MSFEREQLLGRVRGGFSLLGQGSLGVPLLLLAMLGMMILPLPPFLLDLLFTFNIALSIIVLLVCVYALRPLDFAVFPTILLLATLLRLALNVASTRVVLLHGQEGAGAAGKVIEAFGEVVIGGNYVVGMVVFAILMIINFVVVTKGAGRISEVSARFTLDAMPGKQMAIDADLNAGLIEQAEARKRRAEVSQEADFYGSMDGASKFVRGDAIAGLLILFINLIGGMAIGLLQHHMPLAEAGRVYALLTIGDGLVAQLPSLLLSTAAAIMVTRVSSAEDMGQQVRRQMFTSPKALCVAAVILGVMGLVPGMPHLAFLGLAAIAAAFAYFTYQRSQQRITAKEQATQALPAPNPKEQESKELAFDDLPTVDRVGLEVGYRLIALLEAKNGGGLLARIKGVRKKLSQDLGFLLPPVHIRDNLDLPAGGYRLSLMGVPLASGEVYPERELAISPGQVFGDLDGLAVKDPAFGLDALWITPPQREQAQSLGYTVVDSSTVIATHLSRLLEKHAHELLGHEEVQQMLNRLAQMSPKLAEALVPGSLPLSSLLLILQALLKEQVSIRDIRSIAEALVRTPSKDLTSLLAAVRVALGRAIVQQIAGDNELPVITLDNALEQILLAALKQSDESAHLTLEPQLAMRFQQSLGSACEHQQSQGGSCVLLVQDSLRLPLARFAERLEIPVQVLSFAEIPPQRQVRVVQSLGQQV